MKNICDITTYSTSFWKTASYKWSAYFELCKPRVVVLILLTSLVGMFLATMECPPISLLIFATLGIGLTACSGAIINHAIDRDADRLMLRTKHRPIPSGAIAPRQAFLFAFLLGFVGISLLVTTVNTLTALLSFLTLIGYAVIYTRFLKHATSQNIVIGGVAGAAPPVLGWVAVTGHIDPQSLLLFLIIFVWTPVHFWALAIYRQKEYAEAKIPMLPVTHGIQYTTLHILLYTLLLCGVSLLPFVVGMSGAMYLLGVLLLNSRLLYWVLRLRRRETRDDAIKTFRFSNIYLLSLFLVLLGDHYFYIL